MFRSVSLILLLSLAGCATLPQKLETGPRDRKIAYSLAGDGPVTVVFESGLGDGMDTWEPVFGPISGFATALAYDRPGYGGSDAVSGKRTGRDLVEGLHRLLAQVKLKPPYVLVGHSLGGQLVELFARLYPDEVGGVVLVDSRHPDFTRRCEERLGKGCLPGWLVKLLMPEAMKRELQGALETADQIRQAPAFPEVELVVLTRGKGGESQARLDLWMETQREYAGLSCRSTHTVSEKSGHGVHRDDPEAVIEAVRSVVDQVEAAALGRQPCAGVVRR